MNRGLAELRLSELRLSELRLSELRLLGAVLCGGRSSRMGRDKAILPHPLGGTFLEHAISRLHAVCEKVVVSSSQGRLAGIPSDVIQIDDPVDHQGPIVGVARCLEYAEQHHYHGCLVTPVDMPNLTTADLERLKEVWSRSPQRFVCAADDKARHLDPLVAIYPVQFANVIKAASASSDRSLHRLIQSHEPAFIHVSSARMKNINTPEDL